MVEVEEEWRVDVRSFYKMLRGSSSGIFPWKAIWGVKAPQWVSFLFGQRCGGRYSLGTV